MKIAKNRRSVWQQNALNAAKALKKVAKDLDKQEDGGLLERRCEDMIVGLMLYHGQLKLGL